MRVCVGEDQLGEAERTERLQTRTDDTVTEEQQHMQMMHADMRGHQCVQHCDDMCAGHARVLAM